MENKHAFKVVHRSRLDQFLAQTWPELRRTQVKQMIQEGAVLVDGQPALKSGQYVAAGSEVEVLSPPAEHAPAQTEQPIALPHLPLAVVYEDDALIVVDKPAGVQIAPTKWEPVGVTLAQQLAEYAPEMQHVGAVGRSGIVTRMESEVSGLVMAAKNEASYRALRRMIKREGLTRVYSALVEGRLTDTYTIDQPIGNARHSRERMMVAREGRPAHTTYRGQRHYRDDPREYSLLEVRPESSRRHQIRVHLSWYGFPLVGDRLYGSRHDQPLLPDRVFLHLSAMEFSHPQTGEAARVESPLPPELQAIIRYLTRPKSS